MLKNEFHDILPGSSIREVYQDAEAELDGVIAAGRAEQARALDRDRRALPAGELEDALVVVNPSLSARPLRLTLDDGAFVAADENDPSARRRGSSAAPR